MPGIVSSEEPRRWPILLTLCAMAVIVSCAAAINPAVGDPFAPGPRVAEANDDVAEARTGRIIEGTANVGRFSPEHEAEVVDAETVDLRQVFEDLGPIATLWYQHVQTLANPFFEGRVPETRGMDIAAEYVEFYLRRYGLEPAFPANDYEPGGAESERTLVSYRQPFTYNMIGRRLRTSIRDERLAFNDVRMTPDEDFAVMGVSGSGHITVPATFVGYALEDGMDGYTSFEKDTDLSGRIAILFRYEPVEEDGRSKWSDRGFSSYAAIAPKIRSVVDRGAAGIIMVNPPGARDARSGLESVGRSSRFGSTLTIPFFQVTTDAADRLMQKADPDGRDLMTWRRLADRGEVRSVNLRDDVRITMACEVERSGARTDVPTENVGAVLRGRGDLADEWIIIGGHYDHVGYGEFGTSPQYRGQLHPGADDNASGTAGVLILAKTLSEYYERTNEEDLRSIMFVAFSAEESGLHGSRHFVNNSPVSHDSISIMINMDMIGRLRSRNLSVLGVHTADGLMDLLRPHFERSGLTVSVVPGTSGRSDDASFIREEVPALHFFTGVHREYHAPGDRAYTVNPAGARDILRLIHQVTLDLAKKPEMLQFTEPRRHRTADRGYGPVRLGIQPGMGEDVERGVYVQSVSKDTSADEAGIKAGDIIIRWNDVPIDDLRALFEQIQAHEPGDVVNITVLRDDEEVVLETTLKSGEG